MKIRNSEKLEILRSEIKLNPYNPKKHSDDAVKLQAKNIRKNGYLGGIVWNKRSGNCVDGHRRVMALDLINKYDGESNDYKLMVEVVDYDEKTELEQLTYMAAGNTKADLSKINEYIDRIDTTWISDDDMRYIEELRESTEHAEMTDLSGLFIKRRDEENKRKRMTPDEKKALQKDRMNKAEEKMRSLRRHVLIEMKDDEELVAFCDVIGVRPEYDLILKADDILKMID